MPRRTGLIDKVGPLLALAPVRKRRIDSVAIVDGTLVPTRDHRLAAPSKNYRYSANVQVAIDAETRLVIATGAPQPGNRNDCTAYRDSAIKDAVGHAGLVKPLASLLTEVHDPTTDRNETITNTGGQTARADWRATDRLTEAEVAEVLERLGPVSLA